MVFITCTCFTNSAVNAKFMGFEMETIYCSYFFLLVLKLARCADNIVIQLFEHIKSYRFNILKKK